MPNTNYNIHLKGFVGGADFDRDTVDAVLAQNRGKTVSVLIDSLGGSLATGLSISAAFKNHGGVHVHFVGLNASAATIASLGAAHISIDAGAMYLVHQCSTAFFEWGSLNSDQFAELIADCQKIKGNLDKLDLNVAKLYARKCRKSPADLLALMKVGGWLSAQEALEWGFVDEITDLADEPAPRLTDAIASALASAGMPLPNIPVAEAEKDSAFSRFLAALTAFFKPNLNSMPNIMKKHYQSICSIIGVQHIELENDRASLSDGQLSAIEQAIAQKDNVASQRMAEIEQLSAKLAELRARLEKSPADLSKQVVEPAKPTDEPQPANEVEAFVRTYNSAYKLFHQV